MKRQRKWRVDGCTSVVWELGYLINKLTQVQVEANNKIEDANESKIEDGMDQNGDSTSVEVPKLHASASSRYLHQKPWSQQYEQHHCHKHWPPVSHLLPSSLSLLSLYPPSMPSKYFNLYKANMRYKAGVCLSFSTSEWWRGKTPKLISQRTHVHSEFTGCYEGGSIPVKPMVRTTQPTKKSVNWSGIRFGLNVWTNECLNQWKIGWFNRFN